MGRGTTAPCAEVPCSHERTSATNHSPSSSPLSLSPPGSGNATSTSRLIATFKLSKTCTTCGKAIKTQGKVCAKCKMRKYRERKKEQEVNLRMQMKAYREQEDIFKARIKQLEEELRMSDQRLVEGTSSSNNHSSSSESSTCESEKLLAQHQQVLLQQQEIIAAQQSVIAQQQHIINQHNLGHLTNHLHNRRQTLDNNNTSNAIAALSALSSPAGFSSSPAHKLPSPFPRHHSLPEVTNYFPSSSSPSSSLHSLALLVKQEQHHQYYQHQHHYSRFTEMQETKPSSPSDNRMSITSLLSTPSQAEMCSVSCV